MGSPFVPLFILSIIAAYRRLRHILMVVRCLLIEPFPESALNEEAAKMLLEVRRGAFASIL